MTEQMAVGDVVAAFLQQCGVDTAFGVISIHNIPILDAISRRNAVRFVTARGEAGAGHMADAYARASGRLGALVTSTGPGAANATGALVEAGFAGTPLLHITGQTATPNVDRKQGPVHDVPAQLDMLAAVSKAAYRVRAAETALGTLMHAAAEALTPPMGPVSVEIPIDIQRTRIAAPAELDHFALPIPAPAEPSDDQLAAIVSMIRAARRPMFWLGTGARRAKVEAAALAKLGIPIVTSWNGRGVLPEDHPLALGGLNNVPEVEAFYDSVDLMVVVGGRLRGHETRDQTLRLPTRRIQIDIDPAANGRTYTSDLFVCGEAHATLAALLNRLDGQITIAEGYGEEIAALKAKAIRNYHAGLRPYQSFPDDLRAAMPRDALWVRDITLNNSTWGNRTFPVYDPRDSIYPVGAGIGPGLPLGIGAALGAPGRKVVCMCGDGGFFLSLAELWTAVQENVDVVFLVMNDNGYGVIKHIQTKMYDGRHIYGDVAGPDFARLAEVAGMPFQCVSRADQLGDAVKAGLNVSGPALVEVDMGAIGPYPPYFAPPPFVDAEKEG